MRRLALSLCTLPCLLLPAGLAQSEETTLDKIARTGTITLGYRDAEPPFSYKTPNGKVVGFSIDLCDLVVDDVKRRLKLDHLKVEHVLAAPATRFILVKSGKIDLECAATTNTAERRKIVSFSYPHFQTATQFVTRRADNITTLNDLAGRTVASASGTVNIDQLNAINRERKLNIGVLPTKTNEESFSLVVSGRASAFVMDGILLAAMVAQTAEPSRYRLSEETLSKPEPYGLMIRHGDEDFKMVVNETLKRVFTGAEIDALYKKWFQSPIPPDGMNLNLPMSTTLRDAFARPQEYRD
jgi:glutamate/aspartate transport system substrate-binding protein|nr:amino acid ABC transporter substrate-binding protein [Neorhizobium tomejilense]